MQKRNLIILSLFLISVLIISGCNAAVGGNRNTRSSSVLSADACPYTAGQPARVSGDGSTFYSNENCYKILGCRIINDKSGKRYVAQIFQEESNPKFCGESFITLNANEVEYRDSRIDFWNANR
ncbi:hypothetical protein HYT57_01660 [Candidatus Woesearchaeota archaeon]|nr:hypothetical protein [Candidatus Woesearchaeota archaeon]